MNAEAPPEIRRYLAAVEQATFALPADRRAALLADLGARIKEALAQRPEELTDILAELGDPQEIAATALQESDRTPAPVRRQERPQVVVTLLALSSVLSVAGLLPNRGRLVTVALVVLIVGLVALWRSAWWTPEQKWIASAVQVLAATVLRGVAHAMGGGTVVDALGTTALWAAWSGNLAWLWRRRVTPVGPGRNQWPLWARVLCWSAPLVILLGLVIAATVTVNSLNNNIQSGSLTP